MHQYPFFECCLTRPRGNEASYAEGSQRKLHNHPSSEIRASKCTVQSTECDKPCKAVSSSGENVNWCTCIKCMLGFAVILCAPTVLSSFISNMGPEFHTIETYEDLMVSKIPVETSNGLGMLQSNSAETNAVDIALTMSDKMQPEVRSEDHILAELEVVTEAQVLPKPPSFHGTPSLGHIEPPANMNTRSGFLWTMSVVVPAVFLFVVPFLEWLPGMMFAGSGAASISTVEELVPPSETSSPAEEDILPLKKSKGCQVSTGCWTFFFAPKKPCSIAHD